MQIDKQINGQMKAIKLKNDKTDPLEQLTEPITLIKNVHIDLVEIAVSGITLGCYQISF